MFLVLKILAFILLNTSICNCYTDQGKWDFQFSKDSPAIISIPKTLFKGARIFVQVMCSDNSKSEIAIQWSLSEALCWNDVFLGNGIVEDLNKNDLLSQPNQFSFQSPIQMENCTKEKLIKLNEAVIKTDIKPQTSVGSVSNGKMPYDTDTTSTSSSGILLSRLTTSIRSRPIFTITKDGIYILVLKVYSTEDFKVNVHVEIIGTYGYLSAADWPLLPFYGAMCLVYVILGLSWLVVSFLQWRELIRIQFWIGGVILLGMLEKATFYAEYQSINSTGESVLPGAAYFAELVSCGKRTLARMLVIIVSLGFGIVKPRLGAMLHRVVVVGSLYFSLAALESYLRVYDEQRNILLSTIPLALLDSTICWWIFTSLVHTTRTLRLRHNLIKLQLYQHFMHTLMFAVIASVIYMLYSIKEHRLAECLTRWKEIWLDAAYWHLLFSVILVVIMILWRPMNNSQRYAFTPLLDPSIDDDDDDEEVEQFINESISGVKMRPIDGGTLSPKPSKQNYNNTSTLNPDQDMQKVKQQTVPSFMDATVLPLLDSDEELMNTKFEVSKMQ